MLRRHTPDAVARRFGVAKATVIGWCQTGLMPAVNVASLAAHRKRWRMSDDDIEAFERKRANKPDTQQTANNSRRSVRRPVKDFFAAAGDQPTRNAVSQR